MTIVFIAIFFGVNFVAYRDLGTTNSADLAEFGTCLATYRGC